MLVLTFPSNLAQQALGTRCRLAGRLLVADDTEALVADASASVRVRLQQPIAHPPGTWVVFEGVRGEPLPSDRSEFAQPALLDSGREVSSSPGRYLPNADFARFSRVGPRLAQRSRACQAVREYFAADGFLEAVTPTRVAAPGTDVYLQPIPSGEQWLVTSPEFHLKRLLVGGIPRVFELARCFREDEQGRWHEPEFSLLEWYRSFEEYDSVMRDTEQLLERVRLALDAPRVLRVAQYEVDLTPPFERLTTREVFARFADVADVATLAGEDESRYFSLWVDRVEPALAALGRPVFVTEFPLSQAALARPSALDPSAAERFELFVGPVELCNGYGELTSPAIQRQRFEHDVRVRAARSLTELPIDETFLSALGEGLPPCSGNALGFDRLVALLLGTSIQDVIAFPAGRITH